MTTPTNNNPLTNALKDRVRVWAHVSRRLLSSKTTSKTTTSFGPKVTRAPMGMGPQGYAAVAVAGVVAAGMWRSWRGQGRKEHEEHMRKGLTEGEEAPRAKGIS